MTPRQREEALRQPEHNPECVACGEYHGSVSAGKLCLEEEIRRLRRVVLAYALSSKPL